MISSHTSVLKRNKAVLKRVSTQARPKVSQRLTRTARKIQAAISRKTSEKIHLKIVFQGGYPSAIELSSNGLIALEYGREVANGNGMVGEVISGFSQGNGGAGHDE